MDAPNRPDLLRTFLAEADVPCPGCGYNLRGLTTEACPECNQALALRVGLVEPQMRLYVAGMVGLAAGAGFSGLLLLYEVLMTLYWSRGPGPWNEFTMITGTGLVVEGALLAAWLRWGKRVRRLSVAGRAALTTGAWVLTLLNLLIFAWMIR